MDSRASGCDPDPLGRQRRLPWQTHAHRGPRERAGRRASSRLADQFATHPPSPNPPAAYQPAVVAPSPATPVARSRIPGPPLKKDPVIAPGDAIENIYAGSLRDYSACAKPSEVGDLTAGILPLGRYAFGFGDPPEEVGPELFMGKFNSGAPMEFNGVLVCAPQNSGKTSLIVRWAEAATRARLPSPYAVFIIDVKGNLRKKLADRLAGPVYSFSTAPMDTDSDRINFLDGPMGLDAAESDRIRQLVTALLPSRGFVERGGIDEYHYNNRVIWLNALSIS